MRPLSFCILIVVGPLIGALADGSSDDHGLPHAVAYDLETFHTRIALHPHFVMFYAPWFVSIFVSAAHLYCVFALQCVWWVAIVLSEELG